MHRCTACVLEGRGMSAPLSQLVAAAPASLGNAIGSMGLRGAWATALRLNQLQNSRQRILRQIFDEVDVIVAVSEWLRQVLLRNAVPEDKLLLCRQGATSISRPQLRSTNPASGIRCRLAYAGRLHRVKGVHVVIDALRRIPGAPLELDIYGIPQEPEELTSLRERAGSDRRIRFLGPVANEQMTSTLDQYSAVVIPSLWLETGPLTVYDAFAAGVPVIGSRRGGIAELVTHGRNGILVEPGDVSAWPGTFAGMFRAGIAPRSARLRLSAADDG